MIKTPTFWENRGLASTALLPLSYVWRALGFLRHRLAKTSKAALPVICVGNITAGGTGKTPFVSLLYDLLGERGFNPAILTRGYGGSELGPLWVDGSIHNADDCGDEPLMLAEGRDVLVARDRVVGAAAIAQRGIHNVIIMDDGLQNPFLAKDLKIGVFDGTIGLGNGRVIPAGPLREPAIGGMNALDIVIINGEDETNLTSIVPDDKALFSGTIKPDQTVIDDFDQTPLLAFAGIGRPQRFFATLRRAGGNVVHSLAFADHHPYSLADLTTLQQDAHRHGAQLVTTRKDWMRLPADWRDRIAFLPITMDLPQIDAIIAQIISLIDSDNETDGATDTSIAGKIDHG